MSAEYRLTKGRIHGAARILSKREASAYRLSIVAQRLGQVEFAASLRGKARAYREAMAILAALENDTALPSKAREFRKEGQA